MPNRPSPDEISRAVDLRDGIRALQRVAHSIGRSQNLSINKLFLILTEIDSTEVEHKTPEVIRFLQEVQAYLDAGIVDDSEGYAQ